MKWKIIFVVLITLIILVTAYFVYSSRKSYAEVPLINITYENIEDVLSRSSLVSDLPKNAVLLLRFYSFNSGQREWEKSYVLRKGIVREGFAENADLILTLHSGYLGPLTTHNFCSVITAAKKNGDLGTESSLSKAELLWKFKGMTKYKDCLGL